MDDELKECIKTIAEYSIFIDSLGKELNKFLDSYKGIESNFKKLEEKEESSISKIDDVRSRLDKIHTESEVTIKKLDENVTLLNNDTLQSVIGATKSLEKIANIISKTLPANLKSLNAITDSFKSKNSEIEEYSNQINDAKESISKLPELLAVSKSIQQSLGVLSNIDELEIINQSILKEIKAVNEEKKEIIEIIKQAPNVEEIISKIIDEKFNVFESSIIEKITRSIEPIKKAIENEYDADDKSHLYTIKELIIFNKNSYPVKVVKENWKGDFYLIVTDIVQKENGWQAIGAICHKGNKKLKREYPSDIAEYRLFDESTTTAPPISYATESAAFYETIPEDDDLPF